MRNIEAEIRKTISELKKHKEVEAIVLFGSYAKGKTKPLSDIDIAVVVKKPNKKIEAEISSHSSNVLDVVNFHRLPLYIQFEVLKHGNPLYVKDKKFFSQTRKNVVSEYLEISWMYKKISARVLTV